MPFKTGREREGDQRIIGVVAQRVSNTLVTAIENGSPRTNGSIIWLPFSDATLSLDDLVGIASHEGSHIRFETPFNSKYHETVCPENPILGQAVLNVFEDYRINMLLKKAYRGFWMDLDMASEKLVQRIVTRLEKAPVNVLTTDLAAEFILDLVSIHVSEKNQYYYDAHLKTPENIFKFSSKHLGVFWKKIMAAFKYVKLCKTFSATLAGATIFIAALKKLLEHSREDSNDRKQREGNDSPTENERKTNGEASRKDQKIPAYVNAQNNKKSSPSPRAITQPFTRGGESQFRNPASGGAIPSPSSNQKLGGLLSTQRISSESRMPGTVQARPPLPVKTPPVQIKPFSGRLDPRRSMASRIPVRVPGLPGSIKAPPTMMTKNARVPVNSRIESTKIEIFKESGKNITVEIINNAQILRKVNNITRPAAIYDEIIRNDHYQIAQLRNTLASLHQRDGFDRMKRRGIVCSRDLTRVVASKGLFDRPFMTCDRSRGAKLLIVVDESGSMSAGPHGIMPISTAKRAAIILAEALRGTRIKFGVAGFSAIGGRLHVIEKVYKTFDEEINPEKLGAIWVSNRSMENRDGTSFTTIASHFFKNPGADVPIMIVISDGTPYHGGTDYMNKKALHYTETAVMKLKQRVKMFAISIDQRGTNYLENIYGKQNYIVLKNHPEIVDKLVLLVRSIAEALP